MSFGVGVQHSSWEMDGFHFGFPFFHNTTFQDVPIGNLQYYVLFIGAILPLITGQKTLEVIGHTFSDDRR